MPVRCTLRIAFVLAVAVTGAAACVAADSPAPEFRAVATVQEVMDAITIPASDAVWNVAVDPPEDADGWQAVTHHALALAESGNLLLMEGRAVDRGEWMDWAREMIDAAVLAAEAARARDMAALVDAGDLLYESCLGCHQIYMHPQYEADP